jgi:hypothetical protein
MNKKEINKIIVEFYPRVFDQFNTHFFEFGFKNLNI